MLSVGLFDAVFGESPYGRGRADFLGVNIAARVSH